MAVGLHGVRQRLPGPGESRPRLSSVAHPPVAPATRAVAPKDKGRLEGSRPNDRGDSPRVQVSPSQTEVAHGEIRRAEPETETDRSPRHAPDE